MIAFLADTLAMWGVEGRIEPGDAPVVAVIRVDETTIAIERAPEGSPFRWLVHVPDRRPRPCGSLVGVLTALRTALGVERGSALRIAARAP